MPNFEEPKEPVSKSNPRKKIEEDNPKGQPQYPNQRYPKHFPPMGEEKQKQGPIETPKR